MKSFYILPSGRRVEGTQRGLPNDFETSNWEGRIPQFNGTPIYRHVQPVNVAGPSRPVSTRPANTRPPIDFRFD